MDNTQLTHHGIKGMKWGVRRTPSQLGHKPSSAKAKKPTTLKGKLEARKKLRAKQKAAEAARKAKQTKEEYEAAKKKAIESGTAEDVLKYKGKLSNQELQTAVNRLNMESQLSQLDSKTKKTGLDKLENAANKLDRIRGATEKGISAWNTYAKIHNSLSENDLPVIDGNYKDRAAAKREKAEKAAEAKRAKAMKKLVESGTPEEIANHFGKLSVDNLKDAANRFDYEARIKDRMSKKKTYVAPDAGEIPGMRTRKFKRKKNQTLEPDDILSPSSSSRSESAKSSSPKNTYETNFTDVTPSGVIDSGRSYVSGLLSAGVDREN